MEEFKVMLNLQLQLFLLIALGYLAAKKGIIRKSVRSALTDLFIYFILPCNIFNAFHVDFAEGFIVKGFIIIVAMLVNQAFCLLLSRVLYNKKPPEKKKVFQYGTLCSNCGFMGNPIIQGVYGNEGLLYGSIALIPMRIFMWSFGLSVFTKTDRKHLLKQLLTHPCIIAVELGILRMVTGINLPVFVDKTVGSLSNCVTALSMIVIGSILAEVNFKTIFEADVFFYSFIRLILIPGVTLLVMKLLHIDAILTGVTVLLAGMPAASLTAILAEKYNGDSLLASKCVFVSTIISIFTLPVFCLFV
ncbi:MAG: AEC family transporter [Lachnospiraceae bacterium]